MQLSSCLSLPFSSTYILQPNRQAGQALTRPVPGPSKAVDDQSALVCSQPPPQTPPLPPSAPHPAQPSVIQRRPSVCPLAYCRPIPHPSQPTLRRMVSFLLCHDSPRCLQYMYIYITFALFGCDFHNNLTP